MFVCRSGYENIKKDLPRHSPASLPQVMQNAKTREPRYISDAYELEGFELPVGTCQCHLGFALRLPWVELPYAGYTRAVVFPVRRSAFRGAYLY